MIVKNPIPFFARLPGHIGAFLLYGPDRGKVRDLVDSLTDKLVSKGHDRDDSRMIINPKDIRNDPGLPVEELAKTSLLGNTRVIFVDGADEGSLAAWNILFEHRFFPFGHAFVIVSAGSLRPASGLRRVFERHPSAACIPCYADDERDKRRLLAAFCADAGCSITPQALAGATMLFSQDSALNKREMEKLRLYVGENGHIDEEIVAACLADNDFLSLEEIACCAGEGDIIDLDRHLSKALASGVSAVAILRVSSTHFLRLYTAVERCRRGQRPTDALSQLKPPVFFRRRPSFLRQIGRWDTPSVMTAVQKLHESECLVKRNRSELAATLCRQCLLSIARVAYDRPPLNA